MNEPTGRGAALRSRFDAVPGPVRAGLWMTVAAVAYVCSIAIGKYVSPEVHFIEIAFLRNTFGILFMLPWLVRAGPTALRTRRAGRLWCADCCRRSTSRSCLRRSG